MKNPYRVLAFTGALLLAGCAANPNGDEPGQATTATAASQPQSREVPDSRRIPPQAKPAPLQKEVTAMTFGRGIAQGPTKLTFTLNVTVYADESLEGVFSYSANSSAGTVDLEAKVTCTSLDNEAGRAWVGGTITRNDSTDPRYAGNAGSEIWMRALDRNSEKMQPMVSGPLSPAGRIKNASDYCSQKPWSDEGLYLVEPGALAIFP